MSVTESFLERFEAAIVAAESGLPPLEVVDKMAAVDPRMDVPFGEVFVSDVRRVLRTPEARPLCERLLALVRSPTSTAEQLRLSREACFMRVRLARMLRLAANTGGFASVSVWPRALEHLRDRTTGIEGTPEPASSFGYSIYNPHVQVPIGHTAVALDDVDLFIGRPDEGRWVSYRAWAAAQSRSIRPSVITCPLCGVDLLSAGCSDECGARGA
jgi:hypothetical protein